MSRIARSTLVLNMGSVPVSIGAGGLAPVAAFAGLFVEVAVRTGLPPVPAAAFGAVGGAASLIAHELGHALAARRLPGVRTEGVSLIWLGAATRLEGAYVRGLDQAKVALAGPAASLLVAIVLVPLITLPIPREPKYLVGTLLVVNALLALMSLIPANPLDGYKAMVGLLWSALGSEGSARRLLRSAAIVWMPVELGGTFVLLWRSPFLGSLVLVTATALILQKLYARRSAV